MRSRICLLLATKLEAKPILSSRKWKGPILKGEMELYESEDFDLAIVGIGPVRSAVSAGFLASLDYDLWINLGVAGALSNQHSFEEVVEIAQCFSRDEIHPFDRSCDDLKLQHRGASLITVGEALHDDKEKLRLGEKADLVDMEGYAIALAAKNYSTKLKMIKVVSDDASSASHQDVIRNIPKCMQKLWNKVEHEYLK